jgi:hypothetical protein
MRKRTRREVKNDGTRRNIFQKSIRMDLVLDNGQQKDV